MKPFTKERIFNAGLTLARQHGARRVLKKHIAEHLGCAMGTVNFRWETMEKLRDALVAEARKRNDMDLLTGKTRRK